MVQVGLARSSTATQIMSKLSIFNNGVSFKTLILVAQLMQCCQVMMMMMIMKMIIKMIMMIMMMIARC